MIPTHRQLKFAGQIPHRYWRTTYRSGGFDYKLPPDEADRLGVPMYGYVDDDLMVWER